MTGRLCAFCLLTVFLFPISVLAQPAPEDSSLYQSAFAHTVDVYYRQLGDQSPLYNGRLYSGYGFAFKEGIPYFLSAEFRRESVVYDGIRFDNIPLLYDDLSEAVISKDQGYWLQHHTFYKHIGIYAYRTQVLLQIVQLPAGQLETAEKLEQLRWLEHGYGIQLAVTEHENMAVDTPEDLEALLLQIRKRS